jgi:hypothetical protein
VKENAEGLECIVAYTVVVRQRHQNKRDKIRTIQRRNKHVSTTIELLSETVFSTRSVQSGYKEDNLGDLVS